MIQSVKTFLAILSYFWAFWFDYSHISAELELEKLLSSNSELPDLPVIL